jgi:hypothetical protein
MSNLFKDMSNRTKLLERELDAVKKNSANSAPKMETIMRIKTLVDEHVREV